MRARSVLVAVGVGLVTVGALVPMTASAQDAPPSTVPDIGLPPVTTRPVDAQGPGAAGGGSSRHSGGGDAGPFGAAAVPPLTPPRARLGGPVPPPPRAVGVRAPPRLTPP